MKPHSPPAHRGAPQLRIASTVWAVAGTRRRGYLRSHSPLGLFHCPSCNWLILSSQVDRQWVCICASHATRLLSSQRKNGDLLPHPCFYLYSSFSHAWPAANPQACKTAGPRVPSDPVLPFQRVCAGAHHLFALPLDPAWHFYSTPEITLVLCVAPTPVDWLPQQQLGAKVGAPMLLVILPLHS